MNIFQGQHFKTDLKIHRHRQILSHEKEAQMPTTASNYIYFRNVPK